MTVDRIQRSVFGRAGRRPGDFSLFARKVENWFVDPAIMALDEYGIPVQVGQKMPEGDLDAVLERVKALNIEALPLTTFEKTLPMEAKAYI